jgi:predicted transglutaminase-like cysteine proteinase
MVLEKLGLKPKKKVSDTASSAKESASKAVTATANTATNLANSGRKFVKDHPVLMTGIATALISYAPIPGLSIAYNMSKAYETQQLKAEQAELTKKRVDKLNKIQRQVNQLTV